MPVERALPARPPLRVLRRTPELEPDAVAGLDGHCACGGECSDCAASAVPTSVRTAITSEGLALDAPVREPLERTFGRDLRGVRIHSGAAAAHAAREVRADAFTVGSDVVFGADRFAPATDAGARLLRHELVHVIQQGGGRPPGDSSLFVGSAADRAEREAEAVADLTATRPAPPIAVRQEAGTLQRQEERSVFGGDEGEQTTTPPPAPPTPTGVCGPNVTAQFRRSLRNIESTFAGWPRRSKLRACRRVLIPVTAGFVPDINGWDTLPLFQGDSAWLRRPPVYRRARHGPCATPTSSDPTNTNAFAAGHEDPATCSNTVQFENGCWLNGTVNYATFGVMVRLCEGEFTLSQLVQHAGEDLDVPQEVLDAVELALWLRSPSLIDWAELLIRGYKAARGSGVDTADLPVAWVRAFYGSGSSSAPPGSPNRPRCASSCRLTGRIVNWDWVWEPVKARSRATPP
jgi:hypothetical protein